MDIIARSEEGPQVANQREYMIQHNSYLKRCKKENVNYLLGYKLKKCVNKMKETTCGPQDKKNFNSNLSKLNIKVIFLPNLSVYFMSPRSNQRKVALP